MSLQTFAIVRPEHLNHHGFLFGGQLLLWVDEYAWLAAARENPGCRLVTRAMDTIEFHHRVQLGAILRFDVREKHRGQTSLSFDVDVWSEPSGTGDIGETRVFSTVVTFVNVDADGHKTPLCGRVDRAPDGCP